MRSAQAFSLAGVEDKDKGLVNWVEGMRRKALPTSSRLSWKQPSSWAPRAWWELSCSVGGWVQRVTGRGDPRDWHERGAFPPCSYPRVFVGYTGWSKWEHQESGSHPQGADTLGPPLITSSCLLVSQWYVHTRLWVHTHTHTHTCCPCSRAEPSGAHLCVPSTAALSSSIPSVWLMDVCACVEFLHQACWRVLDVTGLTCAGGTDSFS